MGQALAGRPNLELKRLPSYSPQRNGIERFWELLRRRAAPNRLSGQRSDLKASIRTSLRYFQTARRRITTRIANCYPPPAKQTALTGT